MLDKNIDYTVTSILCIVGCVVLFMYTVMVIYTILVTINKYILYRIVQYYRRRKLKSRYPNITLEAKCFCKDCIFYGNHKECTMRSNWIVEENDFCSRATPNLDILKKGKK